MQAQNEGKKVDSALGVTGDLENGGSGGGGLLAPGKKVPLSELLQMAIGDWQNELNDVMLDGDGEPMNELHTIYPCR